MLSLNLNANKSKYIINAFANGCIDIVKTSHSIYGDAIFDFISKKVNHRAIFYSIKNGHFDIVNYYLKSSKKVIRFSDSELHIISRNVCNIRLFENWIENYSKNDLSLVVDHNKLLPFMIKSVVDKYDLELLDIFIKKYPDCFNDLLNRISSNNKGIQFKRELKLSKLL